MLSLVLLIAVGPQAEVPTSAREQSVIAQPSSPDLSTGEGSVSMPTLSDRSPLCDLQTTPINDIAASGSLMWRGADQSVGLYRLLDRRIGGCPAPLLVSDRVPGSNAVGREAGRGGPSQSVMVVRP